MRFSVHTGGGSALTDEVSETVPEHAWRDPVKGSIRRDLERGLSRREWISGLVGLGMSTVAGKVVAQPSMSPVMRPTPGEPLIYDDFSAGVWPSPRWMKFRSAEYDLWDPETRIRCPGAPENSLTIDLPRFTTSHPNHVQPLMRSTTAFDIEQSRSFVVRVEMAVRTFGTEHNPFSLHPGHPRLATGALVLIDPDTGMVFDFFVSNDRIRPLYERLPSARKQLGPYPAYSILVDAVPTQTGEWHLYEGRYDRAADRVEGGVGTV